MAFRDDRDALAARAASLEKELSEAREKLVAVEEDAAEAPALRERVARLEGETAGLKRGLGPWASLPDLIRLLLAGAIGGLLGAGLMLWLSPSKPAADSRHVAENEFIAPAVAEPVVPVLTPPPVPPPTPPVPQPPQPVDIESPSEHTGYHIQWSARVVSAEGLELAAGTECVLGGAANNLRFFGYRDISPSTFLVLTCGETELFDLAAPNEGAVPLQRLQLFEQSLEPGSSSYVYQLHASDHGRGGGRAQLEVDTLATTLVVWREEAPAFRVVLSVEPDSSIRVGDGVFRSGGSSMPPVPASLERDFVVERASSDFPVEQGDHCLLELGPNDSLRRNCHATLRCGRRSIYRGVGRCRVIGGEVVDFRDEQTSEIDDEPAMLVDLGEGTLDISDDEGGGWSLRLLFDSSSPVLQPGAPSPDP